MAEGLVVVVAEDGEGGEDVVHGVAGETVKEGEEGVELAFEVEAALVVPGEGLAAEAHVAGEGGDVAGGVGEFEDAGEDEVAQGGAVEVAVVGGGGEDGELFNDEEV